MKNVMQVFGTHPDQILNNFDVKFDYDLNIMKQVQECHPHDIILTINLNQS